MSQVHEHQIQLRWSDPDSYGHVNHARALSLLEDARLAMVNGTPGDAGLILARLEVDYLRQLYYRAGERLCVRSVVTRLGSKSFHVRQELIQDDEVAIRADVVMVLFQEREFWSRYQAA